MYISQTFLACTFHRWIFHSHLRKSTFRGATEHFTLSIKCPIGHECCRLLCCLWQSPQNLFSSETLAPTSSNSCKYDLVSDYASRVTSLLFVSLIFPFKCLSQNSLLHASEVNTEVFSCCILVSWTYFVGVGVNCGRQSWKGMKSVDVNSIYNYCFFVGSE
jgi:hypothetical protein